MDVLLEIVKLGSIGIVSGVFGAYLAVRRFKLEKSVACKIWCTSVTESTVGKRLGLEAGTKSKSPRG